MYVYQLAKELLTHGHDCAVLSISNDKKVGEYNGIKIFYVSAIPNISQEQASPSNFNQLYSIIQTYNPDIYHQHTNTPSLGVNHIAKLFQLGIKTIFTAHITNFSCIRGDLLLFGDTICDGILERNRCLNCYLSKQGFSNSFKRDIIIRLSEYSMVRSLSPSLNIYDSKLSSIQKFKQFLNHLVVVSKWQSEVLIRNNFDINKMSICRQAVEEEIIVKHKNFSNTDIVKIGFVGRIVKIKGLDFLIRIFNKLNPKNAELHVAGIKSNNEIDYYNEVRELSKANHIFWNEDLNFDQVINFLDSIDVLVVPSFWLETGPYVIFEAFARKVPVLAFNKGGAVELISNNLNGWMVDTESEFENKLNEIVIDKKIIKSASLNIDTVRTTKNLYKEMVEIYNKLI